MHIIFIRNYKKKAVTSCVIISLWIVMFLALQLFLSSSFLCRVTINDCLVFSYPLQFEIGNVYYSEKANENAIETGMGFQKAIAEQFSSYQNLMGKFSFDYPSSFVLSQQNFPGSEILYHIDYHNKPNTTHGFVQVWQLPYSLKEFLDQSKAVSDANYKQFESRPITVNNVNGYIWDYVAITKDGKAIKGSEVFLQKDNKMYRISYFVPENLWNKAEQDIFFGIVSSFKIL